MMQVNVMVPSQFVTTLIAKKVTAEAPNGFFTLLPRHVDFVTALVPSVLTLVDDEDRAHYIAVDEGVLTKVGFNVSIAVFRAVLGEELQSLRQKVLEDFKVLNENEQHFRQVLYMVEMETWRRFSQAGGDQNETRFL